MEQTVIGAVRRRAEEAAAALNDLDSHPKNHARSRLSIRAAASLGQAAEWVGSARACAELGHLVTAGPAASQGMM